MLVRRKKTYKLNGGVATNKYIVRDTSSLWKNNNEELNNMLNNMFRKEPDAEKPHVRLFRGACLVRGTSTRPWFWTVNTK